MAALRGRLLSGVSPTYASRLPCFARTRPIDSALSKARLPPSTCGEVAEWLKAPHSKFVYCRRAPSRCIPERPDPWAFLECPSVPHPFLSRFVPRRSVAISVAKGRDLFCLKDCARKSVGTRLDPNRGSSRCPRPGKNFEQFAAHDQAREPWRFICSGRTAWSRVAPRLADSRCSRLGHVDPRPHRPNAGQAVDRHRQGPATKPKLKYCGNNRLLACSCAAPVTLNHGMPPMGPPQWRPLLFRDWCGVMRIQDGHWLDHDFIALAVLVIGIGIVMLVALSF
jgi:hypothetical protein